MRDKAWAVKHSWTSIYAEQLSTYVMCMRNSWLERTRLWLGTAARQDKKQEKKVDPVEAELKKYSIITSNPWEPEKPCVLAPWPAVLHQHARS